MTTFLHEIFERQCLATPSALAVKSCGKEWSYLDIEKKANRLARHLREKGLGTKDYVGLYFTRSELPIIAMLGVLKAGGVYIPIDRNFPEDRINHIISDAGLQYIITEDTLTPEISAFSNGVLCIIDITSPEIDSLSSARLSPAETGLSPNDLCYIIYTSGTTGRPKGVMTQHGNVVHFVQSFKQVCDLTASDRVYNGFSYSFDGSVEEIWMAFSNGASLIVATDEMTKIASEAARLISEESVTFFSTVPTFLSMIEQPLPTVRLIILSGEVCPPELVSRWAANSRRMLNVYGPTEATVNTTAWECVPGKEVRIGRPLPGYQVYVLNEKHQPVAAGQKGELHIGGEGLAKGYLNQIELTRKTFVEGALAGQRLYKTGDLVSFADDGELRFHGRLDSQVKIRGYRIELAEIEVVLREHANVSAAAVNVTEKNGLKELAAYVVLNDASRGLVSDDIIQLLKRRLPSYMVPAYLDVIETLPTLASGKVNKKILPAPQTPLNRKKAEYVPPKTDLQANLVDIWQEVFGLEAVSIKDDFFNDLGGHSLLAAKVVSLLRHRHSLDVAIRDIYTSPRIEDLSSAIEQREKRRTDDIIPDAEGYTTPRLIAGLVNGLQAVSMYVLYGLLVLPVTALVIYFLHSVEEDISLSFLLTSSLGLSLLAYPAFLMVSVAAKWLILGRTKEGVYPIYGMYYWRWWLVDRIQTITGAQLLAGSPLMNIYFRLMGARIGKHCVIDTHLCSAFDMISIGENTCIGNETQLMGCTVKGGFLRIGKVRIGRNCYVGIHSYVGIDTVMGDNCRLGNVSALHDGHRMDDYESRQGSPLVPSKVKVPKGPTYARQPVLWGSMHALAVVGLVLFMFGTGVPTVLLLSYGLYSPSLWIKMLSILAAGPLLVVSFCLLAVLVKKLMFREVSPGIYRIESSYFVRKWLMDSIMRISVVFLKPLYTTIYLPAWLRLLGAEMGKGAEISTVSQISPELMVVGRESFFADASIIGGRDLCDGYMEVSETRIGTRSFVGNVSILPVGTSIGDNCLLGVLSVPPIAEGVVEDNTDWLGSPSFQLPRRQVVSGFDDSVIYSPTPKLYVQRYLIDGLRIFIPFTIEILGILGTIYSAYFLYNVFGLAPMVGLMPLVGLLLALASAAVVVGVKWLLIGRIRPTIKPLWSTFVWLNEAVNGTYESVSTTILLPLLGTPYFAPLLRMLGSKIGSNVYIGSTLFSEFDLVNIGDNVAINTGVVVQNHLFEDRIMKASSLHIQNDCNIGNMSVVLYDAVVGKGASLNALSLVMKGEQLPERTSWVGIPCQPYAPYECQTESCR